MIIAHLIGGLGNQMFQYACARRIAHVLKAPLKLDLSGFDAYPLRSYALKEFRLTAEVVAPEVVSAFRRRAFVHKFLPNWLVGDNGCKIVKERSFAFDPRVLKLRGGVMLEGYWQSERYFVDIADIVRDEFQLKTWGKESEALLGRIRSANAVSIHVRRGDYVYDAETSRIHGTCGLDYYERAIAEIAKLESNPHFFVFSDDPAWVRQNLRLRFPIDVVERGEASKDSEDLHLMAFCRHNIIANSSFSWWAGWLNRNPSKRVIAPKIWFSAGSYDTRDLIPSSWVRI